MSEGANRADGARSSVLKRESVPTNAYDVIEALRVRIQNRELAEGDWLRERWVCEEFGVGRSIARRALCSLAEDGLVALEEHRGARVSPATAEEIFDLYEIRAALYGMAARLACMRASKRKIDHMLEMVDKMLSFLADGAPSYDIVELSEAIFSEMVQSSSADAQYMIESVRRKTRWHYSCEALAVSANDPRPHKLWQILRAALLGRDADSASAAAREILYFMQDKVSQIALSSGLRSENQWRRK
jgi:DNA-binding GntR family transcriptional regulator